MIWLFVKVILVVTVGLLRVSSVADGACPSYWTPHSDYCYIVPQIAQSWTDMMALCKAVDGELADITSTDENDYVAQLAKENHPSGGEVWIGGTDSMSEGNWMWIGSGDAMVYRKWGSNQPDNSGGSEHCLGMRTSGDWNDDDCSRHNRGVCKRRKYSIPVVGK
ncbi:lectin-like [Gigantopelta aegis]|uniref:lectin-like n=1 Tax=Gigantopelta aegis TaxID=1735272 RepID=UPI001B88930C|nr:lectin-like [Gigantopelta aegis]